MFSSIWAGAALQMATKIESIRVAETKLLAIAKSQYSFDQQQPQDSWEISVLDTPIPMDVLPSSLVPLNQDDKDSQQQLTIHSVHATRNDNTTTDNTPPLVLLHGYMNAGAYFYRNFGGLISYFTNIYALDMLGWGLSSRPQIGSTKSVTVEMAEDFFVESLEAWRSYNRIDKMILAGHSFGGYMSVAYTEKYPQHVDKLILLSPVGVPDENDPAVQQRISKWQSSWRGSLFIGFFSTMFTYTNPAAVMRALSQERSHKMARGYVERRLPEIRDPEESKTVADYLYWNAMLPGSGEYFLNVVLNTKLLAKRPLLTRIPNLKVDSVTFLYGSTDWMDVSGGLNTQRISEQLNQQQQHTKTPKVEVRMVPKAGHLLMLQNPQHTVGGMIHAAGGKVLEDQLPPIVEPDDNKQLGELHPSWVQEALKAREEAENNQRETAMKKEIASQPAAGVATA